MGSISALIFWVVVAVVIVATIVSHRNEDLRRAYRRLASRYRGHCQPGGWFDTPSVRFTHGGFLVRVDVVSVGGRQAIHYTRVRFPWPDRNLRCEVYPERVWTRVGKFMGMEDVEIGSYDFDQTYIITGSDRAALRNLLNAGVQSQIERLRLFLGNDDVYVSFSQGRLLVKKLSLIRDPDRLEDFVRLAIGLYDQAVLTLDKGIEFVEQTEPPKATEVFCQICGEAVTSQQVFCRRCKTPHHLDCWQYYGACSTYGCQETRYLVPSPKRGR